MLLIEKHKIIPYNMDIPYDVRSDVTVKTAREIDSSVLNVSFTRYSRYEYYAKGIETLELEIKIVYDNEREIVLEKKDCGLGFTDHNVEVFKQITLHDLVKNVYSEGDRLYLIYDEKKELHKVCLLIAKELKEEGMNKNTLLETLKKEKKKCPWLQLYLERIF